MSGRFFYILPLMIIGIFLAACQENSTAQTPFRVGVADVARLMRESEPGKAGIKFLEAQQQAFQKNLDAIQEKLEKNPSDEDAMKELQKVYAVSQQRIQAEGQNVASLIFDTVQKVLDAYRADKGLDVILSQDTIASFNRDIDVTSDIMALLNKQQIEFKPLPEPEMAMPSSVSDAPAQAETPDNSKQGATPAETAKPAN